ncbi:MAG: histidinol-phosphate transaminase, partial [Gammaproteobacteria bacterium]
MNQYWSDIVEKLTPYTPGEQPKVSNLIKLNTNENPYGPSPAVLAAISAEANDSLRLYPDPNSDRVKESVANFYSINAEQVFVGNGSDEILAHTFQALLKHERPVLFPDITYSFYPVYCGLYAIEYKTILLNDAFQISIGDYTTPNGGIIFPNPNAPTGCLLSLTEIEQLLNSNPDSVVVIDEAYVDFGGDTAAPLIRNHPNLLVIQTLSKSRSLAGLRVGFAMGQSHLIEALERVKNSFNSYPLDRLAIAGAVAAFSDNDHFDQTRNAVIASREKLANELKALHFEVLPSSANFLLVRHGKHPADYLAQQLRDRNIIVRHFKLPRIENFLRITVATDPQCQALTTAL